MEAFRYEAHYNLPWCISYRRIWYDSTIKITRRNECIKCWISNSDDTQIYYTYFTNIKNVDHHKSAFEKMQSEKIKCSFYSLNEFDKILIFSLNDISELDSTIKYWYCYDSPISAAKMVYRLWQNVILYFGIEDKLMFDEKHQFSKIIDIVSDYDIAQYSMDDTKPFMSGFYSMNLKLDLSLISSEIFQVIRIS